MSRRAARGKCDASLWRVQPQQAVSSKNTSIPQVPAVFRKADLKPGTLNADIGGGRFDIATEFLRGRGVESVVFDPFNRTPAHNRKAAGRVCGGKADTATVANVLNVIAEPAARRHVLMQAADAVGARGTVFIGVYEGDKSGSGRATKAGFQLNRRLREYLPEVREVFCDAKVSKGVIVARKACPT